MPTETHEHYDADGVYTGKTVVRRESEWTEHAQSRALALGAWEAGKCPTCGNYDSLVPLKKDLRHYEWDEYDGQKFAVAQYRCLACASADVVRRDWMARHEKDQPVTGHALAVDGRVFIARPATEED